MKDKFQLIGFAVAALLGMAVGEMLYNKYKSSKTCSVPGEHSDQGEQKQQSIK
jgi:hypothetical protein